MTTNTVSRLANTASVARELNVRPSAIRYLVRTSQISPPACDSRGGYRWTRTQIKSMKKIFSSRNRITSSNTVTAASVLP